MRPTSLPEIREPDASSHILAIYQDIKQAAVLPQVNLIFRYLATKEGVLEWVWQSLRPLYVSEELAQATAQLTGSIERPGPSPLLMALQGADLATCKTVLDAYNSGNPQNLLALTALVAALKDHADGGRSSHSAPVLTPRSAVASGDASQFPALPRRADLGEKQLALIDKMAARHRGAPGVTPSLYLHLALWPSALEAADIYLQPIIEAPAWSALIDHVIEQARTSAETLGPAITLAPDPPSGDVLAEAAATIETFVSATIPELTTTGRLLAIT